MADVVLTGWYVGFAIAAIVITLVVVLVGMILGLARRIGTQAVGIEAALEASELNTAPLWDVGVVNDALTDIVRDATAARHALEQS